jgi:hypothetical protein
MNSRAGSRTGSRLNKPAIRKPIKIKKSSKGSCKTVIAQDDWNVEDTQSPMKSKIVQEQTFKVKNVDLNLKLIS